MLAHVLLPQTAAYHTRFRLLETAGYFPLTTDMEFHVLELPKFTKAVKELSSELDVWLYLLRYAEKIDPEALPGPLNRPLLRRACEELKMLSQTDLERERYEARRKAQLDYNTGLKAARLEGKEEGEQIGRQQGRQECELMGRLEGERVGRQQGELIGRIHLSEQLLGIPLTPTEQLTALSVEELTRRADALQARLRPNGQ